MCWLGGSTRGVGPGLGKVSPGSRGRALHAHGVVQLLQLCRQWDAQLPRYRDSASKQSSSLEGRSRKRREEEETGELWGWGRAVR